MAEQSVVGVYDTMTRAEEALRALDRGAFPVTQISIIGSDLQSEKEVHGFITAGDVAKTGAGTGAWVGGLFGLLAGTALIFVPGFGPLLVAGPFAASLLGGIEGALAGAAGGGLLGALAGWGVSKERIPKYEEQVKAGKYLLVAHGSREDVARAEALLRDTGAAELTTNAEGDR